MCVCGGGGGAKFELVCVWREGCCASALTPSRKIHEHFLDNPYTRARMCTRAIPLVYLVNMYV